MIKPAQILMLVLLFCGAAYPVNASEFESYHYIERTGKVEKEVQWCVDKSQPSSLLYKTKDERHVTRTNQFFATLEWEMEKTNAHTSLHAYRQADAIIVEGRFKGKEIRKALRIDGAPWYQATSWSLRPFILSPEEKVRFWTIRTDTLEAYKITATKKQKEILDLGKAKEEAIQVNLRLNGLLAPFWKSKYWFRSTDGVFLRFEGPSGPPGAPEIVIEYQGPRVTCDLVAQNPLAEHLNPLQNRLKPVIQSKIK